ncbi:transport permease protein [Longispora fulva]|nr:ABC transporter permease [Longispora fulva]GIG56449.1 transport permease protein [Longispora fulva]
MFGSVLAFEARRMVRNFPPLFFGLAFPVMILAVFGGIYGNEPSDLFDGVGTVDASVPAYVAMVLAVAGLMSLPLGMVEYRSRGILRRLRATPARPGAFLAAQVVVNGVVCLLGVGVLLTSAATVFDLSAPRHPVAFAGTLLLTGAAMFSLGLLIAAVARSESTAVVIANLAYFPMIFLTGATVPLEIMPGWMRTVSDALPLSYGVDALRWAWSGHGGDQVPAALAVLGGVTVACSAAAARLFRWE